MSFDLAIYNWIVSIDTFTTVASACHVDCYKQLPDVFDTILCYYIKSVWARGTRKCPRKWQITGYWLHLAGSLFAVSYCLRSELSDSILDQF